MLRVFNISQMQSSEHRTIAIVTAAYIDDYLTGLIKKKMPGLNSALATRLFGDRGSISTLASKIDIARALGAIPPAQAKEVVLIARIRNRFAHQLDVDSFDHPTVADLVDALQSGRSVTMKQEGKEPVALDADWSRTQRFASAALGLCTFIMMEYVDKKPWRYSIQLGPDGKPVPSRSISVIPPQTNTKPLSCKG